MPIIRGEDQPDHLSPQVLYLWSRRWSLILPALIVTVGTFFMTYLLKEEFVARGQVFVNRFAAHDDSSTLPNPVSVGRLLESDLLLRRVRDEYIQRFGGEARHMPVERFSKQFRVKSEVLQDTSVRKEISPVLQLSVQGTGAEETRFLMQSWLHNFMQTFGNYSTLEAVQKRDALTAENLRLEEDLTRFEQELAVIETHLPMQQKLLNELMNTVASADLPPRLREPVQSTGNRSNPGHQTTQLNLSVGMRPPGLTARLVDLRVEGLMAEEGQTTRSLEQIRAEERAVTSAINDVQTSITELQQTVATASSRSSSLERQIRMLTSYQSELRQRLDHFAIASSVAGSSREGAPNSLETGADVRVLAGPVTPEQKIWPRRTTTALGAGIATFVLSALVLLALHAMRRASQRTVAERRREEVEAEVQA